MGTEELGENGSRGICGSRESPRSASRGHCPFDPAMPSGLLAGSKPSDFKINVRLLKGDADSHFEKKQESKLRDFLVKTNLDS